MKDVTNMHGPGTLLSLAKLHLDVLDVVGHPLGLLLTLHQPSFELRASLSLQKTRDNRVSHKHTLEIPRGETERWRDNSLSASGRYMDATDLTLELCLQHLFLVLKLFLVKSARALKPPKLHLQGQLLFGRFPQIWQAGYHVNSPFSNASSTSSDEKGFLIQ